MVEVAVGTGIGGGTLVRDTETGITREIPFSIEPTIIRRGGGGSRRRVTPSTVTGGAFTPISGPVQSVEPAVSSPAPQIDRTIAGQIQDRPEASATISEFRPDEFGLSSGFRRGGLEATRTFATQRFPEFIRGIGPAIQGGPSFREINPFGVFSDVGARRGEQPIGFEPQFGTVSDIEPSGVRTITGFDILRTQREEAGVPQRLSGQSLSTIGAFIGQDIGREVTSSFQGRVSRGELSVEEATTQAQSEFTRQFEQRTEGLSGLGAGRLRERSGETISRQVQTVLPVAAVVAAPLTGSASVTAAGGILSAGLGLRAGQESVQAFQSGEFGLGTLKLGEAALFGAGAGQIVSGALGPGTRSIVGRQITGARQEQLLAQPFSLGGAEIGVGPRGTISEISFSRVVPGAAQEVGVVVPTFRQAATQSGAERFSIAGGRFVSRTRIQPFNLPSSADVLKLTETGSFIGRGGAGVGGRLVGPSSAIGLGEDVTTSIGTIDFLRGDRAIRTSFGGLSTRTDDTLSVLTGTPTTARIPLGPGRLSFGVQPTGGGPLRISTKDIIDIGGPGSGITRGPGNIFTGVGQFGGIPIDQTGIRSVIGTGSQSLIRGAARRTPTDAAISGSVQAGLRVAQVGPTGSIGQFAPGLIGLEAVGGRTFGRLTVGGGARTQPFSLVTPGEPFQTQVPSFSSNIQSLTTRPPGLSVTPTTLVSNLQDFSGGGRSIQRSLSLTTSRTDLAFTPALDVSLASSVDLSVAQRVTLRPAQESRLRQQFQSEFSPGIGGPSRISFAGAGAIGTPGLGLGLFLPPFGEFGTGTRRPRGRGRKKGRVAPSLTGTALFDLGDITGGPLPTGALPQTRLVPGTARKKKKKKSTKKKKK